jgi:hypothetical protein
VRKRRSRDPIASWSVPGEDQNAPLQFQQPMEMVGKLPRTCPPSGRERHLDQGREYPGGAESRMTALRSRMTAHFPSFRVVVTKSLECLSSACWVLVRSASRKILCVVGSEINRLLARRALRRSSRDRKQGEVWSWAPSMHVPE